MPKEKKQRENGGATPQPGDSVEISCKGANYGGILLPRAGAGSDFTTIKLGSGYNIGIRNSEIKGITISERSAARIGSKEKRKDAIAEGKNFVSLLGCGGTIVNKIDYRTGAVYPTVDPAEIAASIITPSGFQLKPKILFSIASEDMTHLHWIELAKSVADEIKGGAEGVVITHGTDTMSYSSAALSFMLKNLPCPVVFTGSQRSSDRGSSDAEQNLHSAILAAKADFSGVFVCMHENMSDDTCLLHFGTKVRKMHTSRRDAFRSINVLPSARIWPANEKIERISQLAKTRQEGAKLALDTKLNPNVALLYVYPGIRPEAVSALSKYDGVVLIGTGLGHVPVNIAKDPKSVSILGEIGQLIKSGIPVVLTSQTIYGRVDLNVYTNQRVLRDEGVIGNMCDFTPESAYLKLMWVLGHEKKMEKIKEMMEQDMAGEISGRTEIVGY